MQLKIQTNKVYDLLTQSTKRIKIMQGGTRSGKTYNIIIYLIIKLLNERNKTLAIVRESLPSIRGSVLRDFLDVLHKLNLYDDSLHNKTENIYYLAGNIVEFVSIDQPQKIRGRKRDYLFINEANELPYEAWLQLAFRTSGEIILDYNPSDENHWIYEKVIPRDDADFWVTTYLDNPFLPTSLIEEIERLKEADENYWRVYGLGERGVNSETIYSHWKYCDSMPQVDDWCYGLDFGFNHPNALVKIGFQDNNVYWEEIIYEVKQTSDDLIAAMEILGVVRSKEMFCDHARPEVIEDLRRAGFNAKEADKSVKSGIDYVKSRPLFITRGSVNLLKEIKSYKWKVDKAGNTLDEPVKFKDDAMDAARYGTYTYLFKPKAQWLVMDF